MIATEEKPPCPRHGSKPVKGRRFRTGKWFTCTKGDFRRWVEDQSFTIMASFVLAAVYVKSWLVILHAG